ncbi:Mobile element protein [Corynebacterium casei]|uniref:Transposase n=2 Tax=Corynebacterium casei TaxID=160386 RepID=G7HTX4_9CORY|nr:transposase A [Corynebacterium casei LMG S-19264]CCE53639.1 transposase [Corynebacterium casei UCMA 3821]SLM93255.1 Mobile element protein [Corynebacterium casei]
MPKFYSEQFKRDAVALYENNENLSLAAAAAELGVNRASLHQWKKEFGTGKKTRMAEAKAQAEAVSDAERIRALEKENAKLREERDILRKAAKYFAEETRWCSASSLSKTTAPNTRSSGCVKS